VTLRRYIFARVNVLMNFAKRDFRRALGARSARRHRKTTVESSRMETAKEQVQQILEQLPQDASLEDIQYHIYVRQKIEQGLADAEAGRVVSHAEVQQRLAKWLTK
jgi:predicted transcriptional regulator